MKRGRNGWPHGTALPQTPHVASAPSPLAGPWYKGRGELEPARNTATGLDGQAGRGTARPRVTHAPHHRHRDAPPAFGSVPSAAAGEHDGGKGRERCPHVRPSLPRAHSFCSRHRDKYLPRHPASPRPRLRDGGDRAGKQTATAALRREIRHAGGRAGMFPLPPGHQKTRLPHSTSPNASLAAGAGGGTGSGDAARGDAAHRAPRARQTPLSPRTPAASQPQPPLSRVVAPWKPPVLPAGRAPGVDAVVALCLLAGITPAGRRARSPASTGTAAPATVFGTACGRAPTREQGLRWGGCSARRGCILHLLGDAESRLQKEKPRHGGSSAPHNPVARLGGGEPLPPPVPLLPPRPARQCSE